MLCFKNCFNTQINNLKEELNNSNNKISIYEKELLEFNNNNKYILESFKCLICLNNPIEFVTSCKHFSMCKKCHHRITELDNIYSKKCILCKQDNISYQEIIYPFNVENFNFNGLEIIHEKNEITNPKNDNNKFLSKIINELLIQIDVLEKEIANMKKNKLELFKKIDLDRKTLKNLNKDNQNITDKIKENKKELKNLELNVQKLEKKEFKLNNNCNLLEKKELKLNDNCNLLEKKENTLKEKCKLLNKERLSLILLNNFIKLNNKEKYNMS